MQRSVFLGGAATAALAAVLGVSACGGSAAPGHAAPVTPSATRTTAPAMAGAGESIRGIPFYHPSTIRSHTGTSATLTSPDPVTKVSGYYVKAVQTDGWTTVSKSITRHSGHLTIRKSGRGATISIAPIRSGSLVSISTYPAA